MEIVELITRYLLLDGRDGHMNTALKHFLLAMNRLCPDIPKKQLKQSIYRLVDELMNTGDLGRLWRRRRAIQNVIKQYGFNDQRTDAWLTKRGQMITASEIYKAWQTPASRHELIMRKLEPPLARQGSEPIAALLWGTRFEPIAKEIFENTTNCKIVDVSCVTHPKYDFIGASPDGIIMCPDDYKRHNRLVEFKCPISRAQTDGIPIAYVNQMQCQMECTGVDECEYVEYRFKQVYYAEWEEHSGTKGVFIVLDNGDVIYKPSDMSEDDWLDTIVKEQQGQFVHWILVSSKHELLQKDSGWLTSHIADLQSCWDEVLKHREAGTFPSAPAPSTPKSQALKIDI